MSDVYTDAPTSGFDLRRFAIPFLVIVIGCACLVILQPVLASTTWAAILAYATWPLYRMVRRPFGQFQNGAAFCMTVLLMCAVVLPIQNESDVVISVGLEANAIEKQPLRLAATRWCITPTPDLRFTHTPILSTCRTSSR
jgi:hypothetical protein